MDVGSDEWQSCGNGDLREELGSNSSFNTQSGVNLGRNWSNLLLSTPAAGATTSHIGSLFYLNTTLWLEAALRRFSRDNSQCRN